MFKNMKILYKKTAKKTTLKVTFKPIKKRMIKLIICILGSTIMCSSGIPDSLPQSRSSTLIIDV